MTRDVWVTGFWVIVTIVTTAFVVTTLAEAHDGHKVTNAQYGLQNPDYKQQGRFGVSQEYLYGVDRNRNSGTYMQTVNCCKYGGDGDCQMIKLENVKVVAGGYEWQGEFIPESETTASPDDNFYGCKHPGATSHCFFVPPQGY